MSTLIFDFDGTIADTFSIVVGVFRKLAPKGHETGDDEVEVLRGLSARAALKRTGVRWWQIPLIVWFISKAMRQQIDEAKPITSIQRVLAELQKRGHTLIILSTNKTHIITRFLHNNGMESYFSEVRGGIGPFAKAGNLQKIMREHHLALTDCYYIGDEVRDYEASKRVGMRCVSVTWGYNNEQALRAAHVTTIVGQPAELLSMFAK